MDEPLFEKLIRSAAEDARAALDRHPSPEELVAYHLGEIEAAAADGVQEHLALCRECTELVLGAEEFLRAEEQPGVPVDEPRRVESASPAAGVSRAWAYSGWGLAASLSVATVVSLAVWFDREASVPNVHVAALEALPDRDGADDPERAAGDVRAESITGTASSILLVLPLRPPVPALPARADFFVEGASRRVLSVDGLFPQADGAIAFSVPRSRLPPHRYRVRLFAAGTSPRPVAEYALNLSAP